ncbi:MAG: hypothetical protein EBE86_014785 [Hormoscilla sp. GUM202]|nr:hypothetical protein [Hormoscilla sp. GUM202]
MNWTNIIKAPILSLDVPSGVDYTTGEAPGDFMKLDDDPRATENRSFTRKNGRIDSGGYRDS